MEPYNDFEGQPESVNYVVLMKETHSSKWKPIFHSNNLRQTPKIEEGPDGNKTGRKLWTADAGAVDFINEHVAAAAPGTQYKIKNRKGEEV